MNKQQYLGALRQELKGLEPAAVEEIMADFEEHFASGLARGKSEEAITADLGSPVEIARQYVESAGDVAAYRSTAAAGPTGSAAPAGFYRRLDQAPPFPPASPAAPVSPQPSAVPPPYGPTAAPAAPQPAGKVNDTALILVILGNLFLGIPIWIALFSTLFGCWMAAGGIGVAAVVLFIVAIVQTGVTSAILALFGISMTALTILAVILMFFLSKWLVLGLVRYIKWNRRLVMGGQPA
jgi:uncharacterized membrane protein